MKILGSIAGTVRAVVFDIDNTLYERSEAYFAEGSAREMDCVASLLGIPRSRVESVVEAERLEIEQRAGRAATLTETVYRMGITPEQWSSIRLGAWQPDRWLRADFELCEALLRLSGLYTLAFGTNNGIEIGRRTLRVLGIPESIACRTFGPETLNASKPEAVFFRRIARKLDIRPSWCVSIGDREFSDGPPALAAGYCGAIIVPGSRDETLQVIELLTKTEHSLTLQREVV